MQKILTAIVFVVIFCILPAGDPLGAIGQEAAKPPVVSTTDLSPTESETDKIQLKVKDLTIMQMAYAAKSAELTQLGTNFNSTQADLDTLVAKVKKAHGWGDDVVFNKLNSTFERVAKPAPEPSKDAPKK